MVLWRCTRPSRTNTPKKCPFHHRGLGCKSRKSRDTWSNRQIWPWSTEWMHWSQQTPFSNNTREDSTHRHHQMVNTESRLIIFFAAKDGEVLSVQFSHSIVSDSFRPHELQHTRPPCPTLTPRAHPNSCPLSRWCHPTISSSVVPFSSCPQSFPASGSFHESPLHIRWPKYWSFSFSIRPSNEHPGLISFRMDWLDLLAVQGTLKSLLQHHSSKASILWRSAFFIVQLSHPYLTTGKTIALTRQTFVGKVMSLLLIMLSRLVITLLLRSKHLLISWLQSPSAVILEPPKNKVWHCFYCFPI